MPLTIDNWYSRHQPPPEMRRRKLGDEHRPYHGGHAHARSPHDPRPGQHAEIGGHGGKQRTEKETKSRQNQDRLAAEPVAQEPGGGCAEYSPAARTDEPSYFQLPQRELSSRTNPTVPETTAVSNPNSSPPSDATRHTPAR